ncbi:MAG: hypothetical protein EOM12_15115 [Verrucomicrobiae bacterium]|nr:hypothetical protein [Verrucomicrobiae bacterium]
METITNGFHHGHNPPERCLRDEKIGLRFITLFRENKIRVIRVIRDHLPLVFDHESHEWHEWGNDNVGNLRSFIYPNGVNTCCKKLNRIRSVSSAPSAVNILYDGDGNRVKKTVNSIETYYLVDTVNLTGYAQVMEELTLHDAQPTVSRVYTYGLDLISQEHLHDAPTGAIWQASFYGYDGYGNVRFLTDADGYISDRYDYDAYGNLLAQSGATPNNYLYCGEQFDPEVGLYFLRARYMDTVRGRFWTMDVFEGLSFDPVSLHKYLYTNTDPVNMLDPSGYFSLFDVNISSAIRFTFAIAFKGVTRKLIISSVLAAVWLYKCTKYAMSEAEELFPYNPMSSAANHDKQKHCFVTCAVNRCTLMTLIPGMLVSLLGECGEPFGTAIADLKADAYGLMFSYLTVPCRESCEEVPVPGYP